MAPETHPRAGEYSHGLPGSPGALWEKGPDITERYDMTGVTP